MTNTVNSDDITTLYSVEEAASILQLGLSSTYALLKTGKLKGFKIGKVWKISRLAIQDYILTENIRENFNYFRTLFI